MDCSPPGSSVHGILQARILEWVTIPFSRGVYWPRGQTWVSHIASAFFSLIHQGSPDTSIPILKWRWTNTVICLSEGKIWNTNTWQVREYRQSPYQVNSHLLDIVKISSYPGTKIMTSYVLSCFSPVQLFATLWTEVGQTPLSMGFSKQEYWNELSCPPPGDLPDQGSNPHLLCLLHWQVGSLPLVLPGKPTWLHPSSNIPI